MVNNKRTHTQICLLVSTRVNGGCAGRSSFILIFFFRFFFAEIRSSRPRPTLLCNEMSCRTYRWRGRVKLHFVPTEHIDPPLTTLNLLFSSRFSCYIQCNLYKSQMNQVIQQITSTKGKKETLLFNYIFVFMREFKKFFRVLKTFCKTQI